VKLNLFAAPPAVSDAKQDDFNEQSSADDTDTTASTRKRPVVWSDGVAFAQNPKRVQELLSVERYQERWPLIPQEELHASSIQHAHNPSWRWLLHSRRVPVLLNSGALQPAAEDPDRPPCAGIGDASMPVWSCRECQQDMMMQKTLLPPQYVTGTVGILLGIELHPDEPKISNRQSVREAGCVILKYMPKWLYLEIKDTADGFLKSDNADAPQLGRNVIAIEPDSRTWIHHTEDGLNIAVTRTQIPLLPDKISTLHDIQGKTADPGFAAHWKFPKNLSPEALWLAHYVILSRPRSLANLLSFGLPSRKILEAGPPGSLATRSKRPRKRAPKLVENWAGLQGSPRCAHGCRLEAFAQPSVRQHHARKSEPPWYDEKCPSVRAADWRRSPTFRRLADV
jgi:hypothetical protein